MARYEGTPADRSRLEAAITAYANDRSIQHWWALVELFEAWQVWCQRGESSSRVRRLVAIGEAVEAAIERAAVGRETAALPEALRIESDGSPRYERCGRERSLPVSA